MPNMNRFANSVVRLILLSPLHGMMDGSLLLITVRGRRSGKEFTLPVQYVRDDRSIYIVVGDAGKKTWWRNLCGGASVRLVLRGTALAGQAVVWQGEQDAASIARALDLYLRRFPASAALHRLHPTQDGSFSAIELRREAGSTVMVHVALG
jgi:deazaflavin-dependent oxidoreductase (nitroreductase family)